MGVRREGGSEEGRWECGGKVGVREGGSEEGRWEGGGKVGVRREGGREEGR